jgi:hypothetical protein
VRLDVEHRCAIDRVEAADRDVQPIDPEQRARCHPEPVRSHPAALSEDPDLGPILAATRMTRRQHDVALVDPVEVVHHVDV